MFGPHITFVVGMSHHHPVLLLLVYIHFSVSALSEATFHLHSVHTEWRGGIKAQQAHLEKSLIIISSSHPLIPSRLAVGDVVKCHVAVHFHHTD